MIAEQVEAGGTEARAGKLREANPGPGLHLDGLRFLIAGTGRSGSKYVAGVFTRLGLECGHEHVFNATTSQRDPDGPVGDSSHQCAPYLQAVRDEYPDVIVFHQLRNPVKYVQSLCGEMWFPEPSGNEQWMLGHVDIQGTDPVDTAMQMWVAWNDMIAFHSHLTYKVEDLRVGKVRSMLSLLGEKRSDDEIREALKASRNQHHKSNVVQESQIRQSTYYPEFQEAALSYGYAV